MASWRGISLTLASFFSIIFLIFVLEFVEIFFGMEVLISYCYAGFEIKVLAL